MNDYREVRVDIEPCSEAATDVVAALLADCGFESFVPDEKGLSAYIPSGLFDRKTLETVLGDIPMPGIAIKWRSSLIQGQDWNSEWEANHFTPIIVGNNKCAIHSSAHTDIPACKYDIVINPRLAFGTGHHATTSLIIERLLDINLDGKNVMDMGTGTGILAILSSMKGAAEVHAIEIDPMAHENAAENMTRNGCDDIILTLGDANALPMTPTFDLFIANINRNIVIADMPRYAAAMKPGGNMILSGFFVEDIPMVEKIAAQYGLIHKSLSSADNWACLELELKN